MEHFAGLEAFIRTVELGSQAAAATQLGLSRVAVGRQIQALERQLGVRLLQRTTRRQALTEAGAAFFELARHAFELLEEAAGKASEFQTSLHGRLRISAPVSFGSRLLPSALAALAEEHPQLHVELVLNDRHVDLLDEGFDVALRIGQLPHSGLASRRLMRCPLTICAAPAYLARHGTPRTPDELSGHNCLSYTYSGQPHGWILLDGEGRRHVVPVAGNLAANNGDALAVAALAGQGIVLQPRFILAEALADGRLVALLPEYRTRDIDLHAVYPATRRPPVKLRRFLDFMIERFRDPVP